MLNTAKLTNRQVDDIIGLITEDLSNITYKKGNYKLDSFYDVKVNLIGGEFTVTLEKQLDYLPDVELYTVIEDDSVVVHVENLYYKDGVTLWDDSSDESYYKVIRKHNAAMGIIEYLNNLDIYIEDI